MKTERRQALQVANMCAKGRFFAERGKHSPDLLTLKRLAKVLAVPLAYLYAEDDFLADAILLLHLVPRSERVEVKKYLVQKLAATANGKV